MIFYGFPVTKQGSHSVIAVVLICIDYFI